MSTTLWIIRHGETAWNAEGRFQGHVDIDLNAQGKEQARQLAARLAREHARAPFAAAFSSDLLRARATAELAISGLGLGVQLRPALRERNFGVLAAQTRAEMEANHPEICAAWKASLADYVIPGGESHAHFAARVLDTLKEIAATHGGPVLVVTHGGALDCVYRAATGLHLDIRREDPIPNASISRVQVSREGRFAIERWGEPPQ
ncbi:MAG: histidine phosphatase family protein [Myxococcota bacterium]